MDYLIGIGIMVAFFALLTFFGKKRIKQGKAEKHWKDY